MFAASALITFAGLPGGRSHRQTTRRAGRKRTNLSIQRSASWCPARGAVPIPGWILRQDPATATMTGAC